MKTALLKAKISIWIQWKVCPAVNDVHESTFVQLSEVCRCVYKGFLSHNYRGRNDHRRPAVRYQLLCFYLWLDEVCSVGIKGFSAERTTPIPLHWSWHLHRSGRGIWFPSVPRVFKGILSMRDETKTKLSLMKVTQCVLWNPRLGYRETIKYSTFFDLDKVLEKFSSDGIRSRGGLPRLWAHLIWKGDRW